MARRKPKRHYAPKTRCPHCGSGMKPKGTIGCVGMTYWKCRNKKCGRTKYERHVAKPPTPLVCEKRDPWKT